MTFDEEELAALSEAQLDVLREIGNVGAGKDVFLHRKTDINAPTTTFDANQWESTSIDKANANKLAELIEKYFNKR